MDKSDAATGEPDVRLSYLEQELRRKQEMGMTSLDSEGEGRQKQEHDVGSTDYKRERVKKHSRRRYISLYIGSVTGSDCRASTEEKIGERIEREAASRIPQRRLDPPFNFDGILHTYGGPLNPAEIILSEPPVSIKYLSTLHQEFVAVELTDTSDLYLMSRNLADHLKKTGKMPSTRKDLEILIDTQGLMTFEDAPDEARRQILTEYGIVNSHKLAFIYKPAKMLPSMEEVEVSGLSLPKDASGIVADTLRNGRPTNGGKLSALVYRNSVGAESVPLENMFAAAGLDSIRHRVRDSDEPSEGDLDPDESADENLVP